MGGSTEAAPAKLAASKGQRGERIHRIGVEFSKETRNIVAFGAEPA